MARKRHPVERVEAALGMLRSGSSCGEAAAATGLPRRVVRYHARRRGMACPRVGEAFLRRLRRAVADGGSCSAAARALGVGRGRVEYWAGKLGVGCGGKRGIDAARLAGSVRSAELPPTVHMAAVMRLSGSSYEEIAGALGIGVGTARSYVWLAAHPEKYREYRRLWRRRWAERERRLLLSSLEELRPETREAVLRVFGDLLGGGDGGE